MTDCETISLLKPHGNSPWCKALIYTQIPVEIWEYCTALDETKIATR